MITKKRVLVAAIALDGLILLAVLVLHIAGRYQPDLSVGAVSVPIHHTASTPEYIDQNTFFYTTVSETPSSDITSFYRERLVAIGWQNQPGEEYQDPGSSWSGQADGAGQRIIPQQLIVFAGTSSGQQQYLLVAVGLYLSPSLCGDNHTLVIVRTTSAPTASARAAEGFALFDQLEVDSMDRLVPISKGSCSG
jgi:hypothetical protein